MKHSPNLSFCIPVFNEEKIINSFLKKIINGLNREVGEGNYEIIIVDNGSYDKTEQIIKTTKKPYIKFYSLKERGVGLAYRNAIQHASGKYLILSAIDIPFGFSDIHSAKKIWGRYDVIFASKAHPESIVFIPFSRKIASAIYRIFLKILFTVDIKDTQGTIIIKTASAKELIRYCDAKDAFFTAQIAVFGKLSGMQLIEIPVSHVKKNVTARKSRYSILRDGIKMLNSMIGTYLLMRKRMPKVLTSH